MEREKMKKRKGKRGSLECQSSSSPFMCCVKKKNIELLKEKQRRIKKASEKKKEARNQQKKPNVIRTCNNLKPLYPPILFIYVVKCVCIQYPPFIPNQNRHLFGIYYSSAPKQENTLTLFSPPFFCASYDQFPPSPPPPPPLSRNFPWEPRGRREGKREKIEKRSWLVQCVWRAFF